VIAAVATTDVATVLIELGALLLLLAVAARFADRLGLSPIPLYLLAGLLASEGSWFELEAAREFIDIGAQLGIILLLLMLGLEFSGQELVASLHTNRFAGWVDLVANATPGLVAGLALGWSMTAALFLAGITYISSSGIVSKVLVELGRVGNRETPAVLSILVTEDLVMALFLPVAAGLLVATGVVETLVDIAIAAVAVTVAFALALWGGTRLSRAVFSPSRELLLLTLLGISLLVAGAAEQINAPAAVAALLVGIALSGPAAEGARVVLSPLRDLFAAAFFVSFGLGLDPSMLPPALPIAIALAAVTALTKVVTGGWAARRAGIGLPGRVRAGTVLISRGEFSIILAGLALTGGLEPDLGPLAAAYVLILATLGPLITRYADPIAFAVQRRRARRRAA
jgi:CPA2 family monovalent cation:H+ antiporter-2